MIRTYEEIERQTLGLINQDTLSGEPIASSYNNQADYEKRIPGLINMAVRSVCTLSKRLVKLTELEDGEEFAGNMKYALPEDFYQLKSGGVYTTTSRGKMVGLPHFKLIGKEILVPREVSRPVYVEYYAYPAQLPEEPKSTDTLDLDPEILDCAQVYAAAQLISQENEFLYGSLYNDYESRLSRITQGMVAENLPVQDSYCFGYGGDLY